MGFRLFLVWCRCWFGWILLSEAITASEIEQQEICRGDEADGSCSVVSWTEEGYTVAYGVPQVVPASIRSSAAPRLVQMEHYMKTWSETGGVDSCALKEPRCLAWASSGECDANPGYMHIDCAPACFTCDKATRSFKDRCPMPTVLNDIWKPGDLNRMFEKLTNDTYYRERYHLQVIRRPGMKVDNSWKTTSDNPWLVQLDDFLSDEECDLLIAHGSRVGYEPSTVLGVGGTDIRGSSARTSSHTWCHEECYTNHAVPILKRIENLTGVPEANYEHLQLLEYETGQYYKPHTDFIDSHFERAQGVRILTVFLYLNDVESGVYSPCRWECETLHSHLSMLWLPFPLAHPQAGKPTFRSLMRLSNPRGVER